MSLKTRLLALLSQRFPKVSSRYLASAGYSLDLDDFGGPEAFGEWSSETAAREDRAWLPLIAAAKAGAPRADIVALQQSLAGLPSQGRLLEVGCGGGYNSELIAMTSPSLDYVGLDLSPAMVDICRAKYPDREFVVGSAYALPFSDGAFDIVVDGVALLHMPEWPRAIAEYARVSAGTVILHGLTLTEGPTTPFGKYAYGQPTFELAISRAELLTTIAETGLRLAQSLPGDDYDLEPFLGISTVSETWVLERS